MPKLHAEEPLVVTSSEPLPADPALLVAQIKRYAQERRRIAAAHDKWCRCIACRVRRYSETPAA